MDDAFSPQSNVYRDLFYHYLDPALILDARSGLIREANHTAVRYLQRDLADMVGNPFSVLLSRKVPPNTSTFTESLRTHGYARDTWHIQLGGGDETCTQVHAQAIDLDAAPCYLVTLRPPPGQGLDGDSEEHGDEGALERLKRLYGDINNPLQEILSWIELQGNVRLKKPAERLTRILQELRGEHFVPNDPVASDAPSRTADRRVPCSRNTVLIVDDETNIRNLFNNILRLNVPDIALDMADDGRTALNAFEAGHHSLIILDLKMPRMDGSKVLRQIREVCRMKFWQPPSVLLCSGYDGRHMAEEMTESDLRCAFVQKPVSNGDLVQTVQRMMGLHLTS